MADAMMITVPTMDSGGGVVWKKTRSNDVAKMICADWRVFMISSVDAATPIESEKGSIPGRTQPSSHVQLSRVGVRESTGTVSDAC